MGFRLLSIGLAITCGFHAADAGAYARAPSRPPVQTVSSVSPKPKIVIFYASLGFGHISAARSIQAEVLRQYPNAEVVLKDALEFKSVIMRKVVPIFYDLWTKRLPGAYDTWFESHMRNGATVESIGDLSTVKAYAPKLVLEYLRAEKPSMVFSAFNHVTEVLVSLREKGEFTGVPIAQILTDYVNEKYYERMAEVLDMSFVPHQQFADDWVRMGLSTKKVTATGIPVSDGIRAPFSQDDKNRFFEGHGLLMDRQTVTLVSGSAGVGDFPAIVKSIARELGGKPLQLLVVCAKNEGHIKKLTDLAHQLPKNLDMRVFGVTPQDDLSKMIKSSDVVISKAGGLTSTELSVIGKPAILMDINGGQERHNSKFFSERGMALTTQDQGEIGSLLQKLLNDPALMESMLTSQKSLSGMSRLDLIGGWLKETLDARLDPSGLTGGHPKALLLEDEEQVAKARWDFLRAENKEILATYFLWDRDKVGMVTLTEILKAVRRGAKAKILIDGWGPAQWEDCQIKPGTLKTLQREGVEIRYFNLPREGSKILKYLPSNLGRSHDKLMILGEGKTVFIGDRNVQNINFRLQKTNGKTGESYRSVEVIAQGPASLRAREYFIEMWNGKKVNAPDLSGVSWKEEQDAFWNLDRYSRLLNEMYSAPIDWQSKMNEVQSIQFVSDVPGEKRKSFGQELDLLRLFDEAKRTITIISPYINLTPRFMGAVEKALARGVKITILSASKDATDARLSSELFEVQANRLIKMGVKIHLHQGPDFMHAKGMIIDDQVSYIGSHNFDLLSEWLNYESGMIIRDVGFTKQISDFYGEMIQRESKMFVGASPSLKARALDCFANGILAPLVTN